MNRALSAITILTCLAGTMVYAQNLDTAKIEKSVKKAVEMMDRNLPDEAIRLWDEVIALHPTFVPYKYERAICLMMKDNYQAAIEALQPIYKDTMLFDRGYQLIGNCHDFLEDTAKARVYYREGMQRYPESGRLHLEMGNSAYLDANPGSALDWWIKGTRVESGFATNYYQICKNFANSPYRFWALLYGELFLNLEAATDRTKEISELLFATWQAGIKPGADDPINLASDALLTEPSALGPSEMNFPTAFEFTVATSVASLPKPTKEQEGKGLTVSQMVEVRTKFIRGWEQAGYLKKYPNDLLSYQAEILKAGWISEYFWWLSSYGDIEQMKAYYRGNEHKYDTFLGWFGQHSLDFSQPLCVGYHCP
jgi:tetratricopeptide (TPR) repeat protein